VGSEQLAEQIAHHADLASRLKDALPDIEALGRAICASLAAGGRVIAFGNGGSAAEAEHLAAELVGRARRERAPLAALALTDTAAVTAIANDFGFAEVFARQVRGQAVRGDIVIGISTSGRSENVLRGLLAARDAGAVTALLTGAAAEPPRDIDHVLAVPSDSTSRVQELHVVIVHLLCEIVDAWAIDAKAAPQRRARSASAAAPTTPARSPSSARRTSRSRVN
jgi:D-sedoheptulose 7-phosphate isomerase